MLSSFQAGFFFTDVRVLEVFSYALPRPLMLWRSFLASRGGQGCVAKVPNLRRPQAERGPFGGREVGGLNWGGWCQLPGGFSVAVGARGSFRKAYAWPSCCGWLLLVCYCASKAHPLWRAHPQDVFIDVDATEVARLTLMDRFQVPIKRPGIHLCCQLPDGQQGPRPLRLLYWLFPSSW